MKRLFLVAAVLLCAVSARAELKFQEIRTASNNVIEVFFKSDIVDMNEVNTDPALWTVNGKRVLAVNRFSTETDKCDHFVYLTVPTLKNGKTYTVKSPHGTFVLKFDEKTTYCEAIKTNQVAYSALSKVRFANFAIYLGDGGVKPVEGKLPDYTVYDAQGVKVAGGKLQEIGEDASSGDIVYRIDLSAVPEGGPYRISVKGYGASYPFGVGAQFSNRLSQVSFRALFDQRCGISVAEPYAEHNYRNLKCHETIYEVYGPIGEARLHVEGNEPTIKAWGGYHDAGDADRRTYHMDVPSTLLTTFEAFPESFRDDQFNIPDKFDEEFNILGKGNGIPDILDEAEWGTMFWKFFQEEDGQIPWGTETTGYSPFTTYDFEDHLFGSEVRDPRTAAWAAGLFYHFARMIKPYDTAKSMEYIVCAEKAYKAAEGKFDPSKLMYFNVEKYLLTGDQSCHEYVKTHANDARGFIETYNQGTEIFAYNGWLVSFFYSYVLADPSKTDPATVEIFKGIVKETAEKQMSYIDKNAYPLATPSDLSWWGSNVAQGQYAYPVMLMWKLTGEQKYIDAVSQMMDYALGLNPLGKCFMTGVGFNRVKNPHDRESAYTKEQGWGPRPGIMVFGPGLPTRAGECYPAITSKPWRRWGAPAPEIPEGTKFTPRERVYIDTRDAISQSEYTIYQTLCFPANIYPILAGETQFTGFEDPYQK